MEKGQTVNSLGSVGPTGSAPVAGKQPGTTREHACAPLRPSKAAPAQGEAGDWPAPEMDNSSLSKPPGFPVDPRKVLIVAGHHNWIVAAYAHFAVCYRCRAVLMLSVLSTGGGGWSSVL